jgi:hypothetical protein
VTAIAATTMNSWQLRCGLHWCGIFFLHKHHDHSQHIMITKNIADGREAEIILW